MAQDTQHLSSCGSPALAIANAVWKSSQLPRCPACIVEALNEGLEILLRSPPRCLCSWCLFLLSSQCKPSCMNLSTDYRSKILLLRSSGILQYSTEPREINPSGSAGWYSWTRLGLLCRAWKEEDYAISVLCLCAQVIKWSNHLNKKTSSTSISTLSSFRSLSWYSNLYPFLRSLSNLSQYAFHISYSHCHGGCCDCSTAGRRWKSSYPRLVCKFVAPALTIFASCCRDWSSITSQATGVPGCVSIRICPVRHMMP